MERKSQDKKPSQVAGEEDAPWGEQEGLDMDVCLGWWRSNGSRGKAWRSWQGRGGICICIYSFREKGTTEYETVGWHHQLDGHGFEQAPGVGDGQGSLAGSSSWGHEESDMTEQLNWTELNQRLLLMVLVPQWPTYMQFVVDYEEYIQKHKERQTILGNNYKLLYILRNTYNDSATYKHVGVF